MFTSKFTVFIHFRHVLPRKTFLNHPSFSGVFGLSKGSYFVTSLTVHTALYILVLFALGKYFLISSEPTVLTYLRALELKSCDIV